MIYLDKDGVLAKLVEAIARILGREDLLAKWPPGQYSLMKAFGMTKAEIWGPVEACGYEFWAELEPYEWAADLVKLCEQFDVVKICSTPHYRKENPTASHYSVAGKAIWLQRHLGGKFADPLLHWFGADKQDLARRGAILVDDCSKNAYDFSAGRGHGLIFAQPWNDLHRFVSRDPAKILATMKARLEETYRELSSR